MTGEMRFYLLAEMSGWNCTSYSYSYSDFLKNSNAYKILTENIHEVKKHITHRAESILQAYDEITFSPKNVKDCFIIETAINYVALHSFEEFYINPLTINPYYDGRIKSIGELMIDLKGDEVSINELISNENTSVEEKKEIVYNQLENYLDDADDLIYNSLEKIKSEAITSNRFASFKFFMEFFFVLFLNSFLAFMFIYNFQQFTFFFTNFQYNKVMSYIAVIFPMMVFIYDIVFAIYHSYRANILEPYNYAKRFLKIHADRVFDDLYDEKERLFNYISTAIDNKITLENDITSFSKLSSSYVDFQAVLSSSQLKRKKRYRFLKGMDLSISTVAVLVGVVSLIIYLLGIIFQVAI